MSKTAHILCKALSKRKLLAFVVSVFLGVAGLVIFPTSIEAAQFGVSAMNTTAGYAGLVSTSALPSGQTVTFKLEKPDGEVVIFSRAAERAGNMTVELEERHLERAGVYLISAVAGNASAPASTFIVRAAAVDPQQSALQVEEKEVAVGDVGRVLAALHDGFGNPVSDHQLRLIPAGNERVSSPYQPDGVTDQDGMVVFEVQANKPGKASFSLVDVTTGSVFPHKATVVFNEVYGRGGNLFAVRNVQAQVSGDYFVLRDVPDQVKVGEPFSVTVEAVDSQAQTLATYEGKVRFSTTDLQAQLPSDYTFSESDGGEKRFSLAVTLVTPGQQTLTVSDSSNQQMKGEVALTVTQTGSTGKANGNGPATPALPLITSPQPDFVTKEGNVVVAGTVEPLVVASIYDGLRKVQELQSTPQGQFSFDVQNLSEGAHDFTVAATSQDGRIVTSDPVRVIIDKTAPVLKQIRFEPSQPGVGESMIALVESEAGLSASRLGIEGRVIELAANAETGPGWYKASFAAPANPGDYPVTVTLIDGVGNKSEFANYRTLEVQISAVPGGTSDDTMMPEHAAAPSTLQLAAQREEGRVLFSWPKSDNPDVTGYNLYQSVAPTAGFTKVNALPITDATYLLDQQTNPEKRYYKVVAINASGNELANSDAVEVAGYVTPGAADASLAPGLVQPTVGAPPSTGPETWLIILFAAVLSTTVLVRRN